MSEATQEKDSSVKRSNAEVSLPSGLKGVIRRMKLKDMNDMTARSTVRKGNILEKLFVGVWQETLDLGIYTTPFVGFHKDSEGEPIIDWLRVLQGDRNVLLMEIRKLVRGPDFDFDITCRSCKQIIKWKIDLNDLEVYPIAEEAIEKLRTTGKNEFDVILPYSGDKLTYKLLQGVDQNALAKATMSSPDDQFTVSTLQRLVYIPGTEKPKDRKIYVEEMDPEDIDHLINEWQSMDCDIETTASIECSCGKIQEVALPLDEDFLFRRSSRRTKR